MQGFQEVSCLAFRRFVLLTQIPYHAGFHGDGEPDITLVAMVLSSGGPEQAVNSQRQTGTSAQAAVSCFLLPPVSHTQQLGTGSWQDSGGTESRKLKIAVWVSLEGGWGDCPLGFGRGRSLQLLSLCGMGASIQETRGRHH